MNTAQRKRLDNIKQTLRAVHFPEQWITDQTAICLYALIDRRPRRGLLPGKTSLRDGARIRNILDFARRDLNKPVAENTRESYRKQSLKPLYEAGIIELHQTSINDPNTFYTINVDFERILTQKRVSRQVGLIEQWNTTHQIRLSALTGKRQALDIAIQIGGQTLALSSGAHSQLIHDVCEVFAPAYIPGFEPIYVGDTRNKMLYVNQSLASLLNLDIDEHDKLPAVR
jgi:adenine-specific DNA-methyltransferase